MESEIDPLSPTAEEIVVAEEYKAWKKNSAFFYDFIITRGLIWPSLTVQWLPLIETYICSNNCNRPNGADYSIQKLILGTHTSDNEPNYLLIAQVRIPNAGADIQEDPNAGFSAAGKDKRFRIETEIPHEGEVNRARYMPFQYNVIATSTPSTEIHVFDYFKHPTKPEKGDTPKPELRLIGQEKEGYGLAWNALRKGIIVSAANDGRVCVWDIEASDVQLGSKVNPLQKYEGRTGAIEGIDWHKFHQDIFGTVGDDKKLSIWDLRSDSKKPFKSIVAHEKDALSLDFNPFNEYLLATSSADCSIAFWDLRNLTTRVHEIKKHRDEVVNISWSPFKESVLASSGNDRRVMVWDLSKAGQTSTEGSSELLFMHGGHTNNVMELSWNLNEEYLIASVSFDNDVHIWQIVFLLITIG